MKSCRANLVFNVYFNVRLFNVNGGPEKRATTIFIYLKPLTLDLEMPI